MKNIFIKFIYSKTYVTAILILGFSLSSCQMTVNSFSSNNSTSEDSTGLQGVGVKNYEQIFASMVSATGIDPSTNNGNLQVYYNTNKASLPSSNDIQSLQANQLITITNFAGQFCLELLNVSANRQNFFATTEFGTAPTTFDSKKISDLMGTNSQKAAYAEFVLKKIWGEEIDPTQERQDAISNLVVLATDIGQGLNDNNSNLKRIMAGVCAAVLGSGPVIYF